MRHPSPPVRVLALRARQPIHGRSLLLGAIEQPETPSDRTTRTVARHPRSLVYSPGEPGGRRFSYRVNPITAASGVQASPTSLVGHGLLRAACTLAI